MFTPSTVVRLLQNVDITIEYKNTFSFSNATSQSSFFIGKTKQTHNDFTYVRKSNTVKVPTNIETLWNVSYMMFQNSNFGTKWFYAFITDMKYINDGVTEISFEIDVLQTWYFEMDFKNCFIEREHVEDDTIGLHLVKENVDVGDYVTISTDAFTALNPLAIVVATTVIPDGSGGFDDVVGENYSGIYSGTKLIGWSRNDDLDVSQFLLDLDSAGKGDAVQNIFLMPENLIPNFVSGEVINAPNATSIDFFYNKALTDIDGYTPKNNKMFTFPYNFLYVSNNNGGTAIYQYEYFTTSNMEFFATCPINPSPVVRMTPRNYKGVVTNFDEAITLGDYPLCSWTNDIYRNWLAQNVVSAPLGVLSSGLALGVGIATANPIAIAGGAIGVANSLGGFVETAIQPNQSKGSVSGGVNTAIGIQTFGFYPKQIRADRAKIIDSYFDMFGYKVNELKTPNLTSRQNWNYFKMIEVNIFGNVPNNDLKKIHDIFKAGITYWHNDNVGNYNRPNNPI